MTGQPISIERGRLLRARRQRRASGLTGDDARSPDAAAARLAILEFDRLLSKGAIAEMIHQEVAAALALRGTPGDALDGLCLRLYGLLATEVHALVLQQSGGSGLLLPATPKGYDDD